MGAAIIAAAGWRAIFLAFRGLRARRHACWLALRQPETLPLAQRRPLQPCPLWCALREVLSHRVILVSILVQTLVLAALFGTLSSMQQIFDETFGRADSFPLWFALIALIAAGAELR